MLCCYSVFQLVLQGAGGYGVIGAGGGHSLVTRVAPPVRILGVHWSGLACCGWLGEGLALG